jgi:hypothetical protein
VISGDASVGKRKSTCNKEVREVVRAKRGPMTRGTGGIILPR